MRIGFALTRLLGRRRRAQLQQCRRAMPGVERLDLRQLLSGLTLVSAGTADSHGVTVTYRIDDAGVGPIPSLGVYRSATASFDAATADPVAIALPLPALDAAGLPAAAPGLHQVTIPLPGGLPIQPKRPYVVVVADADPASGGVDSVAAFRKGSIAVLTHGGIQNQAWKKNGPPWAVKMGRLLREQGYDKVLVFNWVTESNKPGRAARQAPRLARMVRQLAGRLPEGMPVDLHWIGHSQGTVINTQAIRRLNRSESPELRAGYVEDTLLDPHAANPDAPGPQHSTSGPFGWLAQLTIDKYESEARDPLVFVPRSVDQAQVFYQQTPASRDHGTNSGIYNLWGQVPVRGEAVYFNLTQAGVVHSGKRGVAMWYQKHVLPGLGLGAPKLEAMTLAGDGTAPAVRNGRATYSGTAEPNAAVRLSVAHGPGRLRLAAKTTAGPDGAWKATTRPLAPGTYRVIAESKQAGATPKDHAALPTEPLGALTIPRPSRFTAPRSRAGRGSSPAR